MYLSRPGHGPHAAGTDGRGPHSGSHGDLFVAGLVAEWQARPVCAPHVLASGVMGWYRGLGSRRSSIARALDCESANLRLPRWLTRALAGARLGLSVLFGTAGCILGHVASLTWVLWLVAWAFVQFNM